MGPLWVPMGPHGSPWVPVGPLTPIPGYGGCMYKPEADLVILGIIIPLSLQCSRSFKLFGTLCGGFLTDSE